MIKWWAAYWNIYVWGKKNFETYMMQYINCTFLFAICYHCINCLRMGTCILVWVFFTLGKRNMDKAIEIWSKQSRNSTLYNSITQKASMSFLIVLGKKKPGIWHSKILTKQFSGSIYRFVLVFQPLKQNLKKEKVIDTSHYGLVVLHGVEDF